MNKFYLKSLICAICVSIVSINEAQSQYSDFEDLGLAKDTFWMPTANGSNSFTSESYTFDCYYDSAYASWEGFIYSSKRNDSTAGYLNQYSSYAGGDMNDTGTYAIFYQGFYDIDSMIFPSAVTITGFYISNTTYSALSMKNGDTYAKKFGGTDGSYDDWFKLTILSYESDTLRDSVEVYLADYRYSDDAEDYILEGWKWVDLSGLGTIDYLRFELSSSDTGAYGYNTPLYFCIDNFDDPSGAEEYDWVSDFGQFIISSESYYIGAVSETVIEDGIANFPVTNEESSEWEGFGYSNMTNTTGTSNEYIYSSYAGGGVYGSENYGILCNKSGSDTVSFDYDTIIAGIFVTNSTYTANSMKSGLGGVTSFANTDWFKLTIEGLDASGTSTGTVEVALFDTSLSSNMANCIINTWKHVDLSGLDTVNSLVFSLSSNQSATPLNYVCIDNLNEDAPVFITNNLIDTLQVIEDADNYYINLQDNIYFQQYPEFSLDYTFSGSTSIISNSFSNDTLTIDFLENANGNGYLTVNAEKYGYSFTDTITIEITSVDDTPTVKVPMLDLTISFGVEEVLVNLTDVFTDVDNADSLISKAILTNTNTAYVATSISGDLLTLTFDTAVSGTATITVRGTSGGLTIDDIFIIDGTYPEGLETKKDDQLVISPNPFIDILYIKTTNNAPATYHIVNVIGALVKSGTIFNGYAEISLSELVSGLYIICIETPEGKLVKKIIKE